MEVLGTGQTQIYPRAPSKTLSRLQETLGNEVIGQVHRHLGGQREPRPNTGAPSHPPNQAMAHSSCPLPDTHIHTDSHTHSHTHRNLHRAGNRQARQTPKSDPHPLNSPRRRKIKLLVLTVNRLIGFGQVADPAQASVSPSLGRQLRWFLRVFPALTPLP